MGSAASLAHLTDHQPDRDPSTRLGRITHYGYR